MSVLVLADVDLGRLTPATARVVAAAAELGPVTLLVDASAKDEAKAIAGVAKVLSTALPQTAEALAPELAKLSEPFTHIVASANAMGRDVIPRLAALLDLMPVTDVTAIIGPTRFERPIYAGNATETVSDGQAKHLLTIRASAFAPARGGNDAPVEAIDMGASGSTTIAGEERSESTRPDLSTAQIVVSGGISVGDKFALIDELAEYERLPHEAVATPEDMEAALFGPRPAAEVVVAECDGQPAGFALFFVSFSTFLGKPGLHLEDLFVRPAFRGRGVGKRLMVHLARLAVERGYGRFEWSVLDWNEPAIQFYRAQGAQLLDAWTMCRVEGQALKTLGGSQPQGADARPTTGGRS